MGLVGNLRDLDSDRELGRDGFHRASEILAKRDDIGAILHRHAEAERGFAALAEHESRRVLIAALDRRDIAEAKDLPVGLDRHRRDRGHAREGAGHPQIDAIGRSIHRSAGDNGVLLGDAVEDLLGAEAEGGKLGVAELDEDLLGPLADDVDLVDVGHPQQALADVLGLGFQLGERETVGAQHIERRVDVAVFVVEVRAGDAGRQVAPDVAHLLANLVPQLLDLGGRGLVGEKDPDEGDARLGIAFDPVEKRQLLELLLDLVGDLRLHLGRGRARPGDVHDHRLDREGRVFGAAQVEVGIEARCTDDEDHEQDKRLVRDRPFGQIEALHGAAPRWLCRFLHRGSTARTLRPASSLWTPSVTTLSPSPMPEVTSAASSVKEATVTGRKTSAPFSSTR